MSEMAQPQQYSRAAGALIGLPGVLAADVHDRDHAAQRPVLELTVGPEYERVPPRVLRGIAEHDLGLRDVSPPGNDGYLTVEVV